MAKNSKMSLSDHRKKATDKWLAERGLHPDLLSPKQRAAKEGRIKRRQYLKGVK